VRAAAQPLPPREVGGMASGLLRPSSVSVPRRRFLVGLAGVAAGAAGLSALDRPRTEGPLFVRRFGERGPPLLCLHGLFGSSAFWTRLAGRLAGEARVVAPDLAGFGMSPQPAADYTVDFHLRHLAPLVDERASWIVVGHSMGCALAVELALRRPGSVVGVLLFNAPVYASPERRREIFGRQGFLTRWSLRAPRAAHLACEIMVRTPPALVTRLSAWLRPQVPPESASDYFRHTYRSFDTSLRHLVLEEDLLARLAALSQPIRVVQGSLDRLVDAPHVLAWPANVQLEVLHGVDHTSLLFQEPGRAAAIVRDFAARVGAPTADRPTSPGPMPAVPR
jgi:pimeloyl-ACP methyl ester carboxylesterase